MQEVVRVNCPHCHKDFNADFYTGEAHQHPEATLRQVRNQQIGWAELRDEIRRGYGGAILSVGDEIEFRLRDGTLTSVVVLDIAPYEPNSVVFGFSDVISEYQMNCHSTNHGGWSLSSMADYLDSKVDNLPYELAEAINYREIRQTFDGLVRVRESKLWLPSVVEVFGAVGGYNDCESLGQQFEYFKKKKNRIKLGSDGYLTYWWLRSPLVSSSTYFWVVANGGSLNYTNASTQIGVVPCFSIS